MEFDLARSVEILSRTPLTLQSMLSGLSDEWVHSDYGEGTWSPFDVVGHLIHGDKTDWIPRARIILEHGESRPFEPFDRNAHRESNLTRSIGELLEEFASMRAANLEILADLRLDEDRLSLTGAHPELGRVTMRQLLAAWVVHDLHHIGQIAKGIARQYTAAVGPFSDRLGILGS